jgi:hypothetical protein
MTDSPAFSPQFLADLEAVYQASVVTLPTKPDTSPVDLDWLANQFRTWRARQQERLRHLLNDLHEDDDPLRCPVSLFGTMDRGRLETAHTKTLAWLLDPSREHGFGDRLLRAVLGAVRGPDAECSDARVDSEFMLWGDEAEGRLDILIRGRSNNSPGWLLVIEGKVDALEGHEQLDRYDAWIARWEPDRTAYRVFLTPKGHAAETGGGAWQPMSFLQLAGVLRSAMSAVRQAPGYHFLRYYLAGILMDICQWKLPLQPDAADPFGAVEYMCSIDPAGRQGQD